MQAGVDSPVQTEAMSQNQARYKYQFRFKKKCFQNSLGLDSFASPPQKLFTR